jgi:hypothetical protein
MSLPVAVGALNNATLWAALHRSAAMGAEGGPDVMAVLRHAPALGMD